MSETEVIAISLTVMNNLKNPVGIIVIMMNHIRLPVAGPRSTILSQSAQCSFFPTKLHALFDIKPFIS